MTVNTGKRGGKGTYKPRSWFVVKVCEYCGNTFSCGRADKKTCSTKCRVALHRRDKKLMESGGQQSRRTITINTKAGRVEQEVMW